MTIGEVAARSGMAASAIRYYEKVGLLKAPGRMSGRRVYDSDILHQLIVIQFAKDTGFTIPEIRLLLRGFPSTTTAPMRWRQLASTKSKELDHTLAKVRAMKKMLEAVLSCRCQTLAECARGFANCSPKSPLIQRRTKGGISKAT